MGTLNCENIGLVIMVYVLCGISRFFVPIDRSMSIVHMFSLKMTYRKMFLAFLGVCFVKNKWVN